MHKGRIIELFKNAPEDVLSLTVSQLLEKLQKDVDQERKEQKDKEGAICGRFKGQYIKLRDEDGIFGNLEVEYIFIEDIEPGSFTTDHERSYNIKGLSISFWGGHASYREMKMGDCHDSKVFKELDEAIIISKEDFDNAKSKHDEIIEIIKKCQE